MLTLKFKTPDKLGAVPGVHKVLITLQEPVKGPVEKHEPRKPGDDQGTETAEMQTIGISVKSAEIKEGDNSFKFELTPNDIVQDGKF